MSPMIARPPARRRLFPPPAASRYGKWRRGVPFLKGSRNHRQHTMKTGQRVWLNERCWLYDQGDHQVDEMLPHSAPVSHVKNAKRLLKIANCNCVLAKNEATFRLWRIQFRAGR